MAGENLDLSFLKIELTLKVSHRRVESTIVKSAFTERAAGQ
jgi:hypothetical protein